jgi:hypothetical protein
MRITFDPVKRAKTLAERGLYPAWRGSPRL